MSVMLDKFYLGQIEKAIPPGDPANTTTGYQYQYQVLISGDRSSTLTVLCTVMAPIAGRDHTEESVLATGLRVFVLFPGGSPAAGVIVGCARQYLKPMDAGRGRYWERRFNLITETVEKDFTWQVKHDLGTFIKVEARAVTISDGFGNEVVVNAGLGPIGGSVDVKGGAMSITVKGDVDIKAAGAVSVLAKDVTVKAVTVDVKALSMSATVLKDVSIKAGTVDVKAATINLNSVTGGMVLTTTSQPVCYVTGIPFVGVPIVKAG